MAYLSAGEENVVRNSLRERSLVFAVSFCSDINLVLALALALAFAIVIALLLR